MHPLDPNFQPDAWLSVYDGVVTDRADPLRVGRVRVRVPGLIDAPGVWALPIAMPGGGSGARGFFFVPEVGAEVAVLFKMGDVDHPRYMAGPWGRPVGVPEIPEAARDLSDADTPEVKVIDFKNYELVVDEREGNETFRIRDKRAFGTGESTAEDVIEFDGVNRGIRIAGSVAVRIESTGVINLEAMQIVINGRVVRDTGEEI